VARKSERRGRRISATEASRSFSRILEEVERGISFLVHRHGKDVCVLTSPKPTGRKASECLAMLKSRPEALLDGDFGRDLEAILAEEPIEARPWGS
jgi:antitoxin (DNA-binding transcriptional repressor) of toxin-antitoxin stability system